MPKKMRKNKNKPKDESSDSDDENFKAPLNRPSRSRSRNNPSNVGAGSSMRAEPTLVGAGVCSQRDDFSDDDEDVKRAIELSLKVTRSFEGEDDDDDLQKALELSMAEAPIDAGMPLVKLTSHHNAVEDEDHEDLKEAIRRSLVESTSNASASVVEISDTSASVLEVSDASNSILVMEDSVKPGVSRIEIEPPGCHEANSRPPKLPSYDLTLNSPTKNNANPVVGESVVISDDEFDLMCNSNNGLQRLSDPRSSTPHQKGEKNKPKSDAFLENPFDDSSREVDSAFLKLPVDVKPLVSSKFNSRSALDDKTTQNPGPSGINKFRNTTKDERENCMKGEKSKQQLKTVGKNQIKDNVLQDVRKIANGNSRTPSPDSVVAASNPLDGGSPEAALNPQEATQRMRNVFQSGLDIHLRGEEMQAARAVETELYLHQRVALAWMFAHELRANDGLRGGVLADDMGLGKTLTVIALIVTNHHDGKPLAKPDLGYTRPAPIAPGKAKGKTRRGKGRIQVTNTAVNLDKLGIGKKIGKSITTAASDHKKSTTNIFAKFNDDSPDSEVENRNPAFRFSSGSSADVNKIVGGKGVRKKVFESSSSSEDEFDVMSKSQSSLSAKWSVTSLEDTFKGAEDPREKILDDLDDDDEFNAMTQEEKLEAMKPTAFLDGNFDNSDLTDGAKEEFNPTMNLDGGMSLGSDSEEEFSKEKKRKRRARPGDFSSEVEKAKSKKLRRKGLTRKKENSSPNLEIGDNDSDTSLPEIRTETPESEYSLDGDEREYNPLFSDESRENTPRESSKTASGSGQIATSEPTRSLGQNGRIEGSSKQPKLIIPPKQPAERNGRRRPTLIVCPTSLIDHWNQQIHHHLDKSVNIRVKIHHGSSKALTGADLDTQDIVITTYGTLAAELRSEGMSPLMRAKWLRVVLDEGHYIKNNRSLSTKAAHNLDTERRWVVTGTPIQNNLMELWSLVNWLDFGLYADNQNLFKRHIEKPCKNRDPIGFERLQVLLDTICLRRTKSDKRPDGSPLVDLPKKTITIRQVELTAEEKLFYTAFHKKSAEIVERYHRRGDLMRNYAHVFALMIRLRQLCCHQDLVPVNWGLARKDKKALEAMLQNETQAQENVAAPVPGQDEVSEQQTQLAMQLRQMIKSGVTDDCSVCLDDLKTPVITPCAHVFCRMCIEQVLDTVKPPNCPLCRRPLNKADLLEAGSHEDVETEEDDETLKAMEDIIVEVSSSKVNAMLREMLRIRRDCPGDKIIITSQFTSFLSIIQPLLRQNDFSYTRLDGSMNHTDRAMVINDFQNVDDPSSPMVLLLSLRAGGVGLNLTAANHLMLLDPAWNPATEWQCFDRCHRLGQDKDVNIYKFITKDSIEEKMVEIQDKKTELISGAFQNTPEEARRQRINDIRNIFGI